jgi:hypothetical protein
MECLPVNNISSTTYSNHKNKAQKKKTHVLLREESMSDRIHSRLCPMPNRGRIDAQTPTNKRNSRILQVLITDLRRWNINPSTKSLFKKGKGKVKEGRKKQRGFISNSTLKKNLFLKNIPPENWQDDKFQSSLCHSKYSSRDESHA